MSEWIASLRGKSLFQWSARWTSRIAIPAMEQAEGIRFALDVAMGFFLSQAALYFSGAPFVIAWFAARLLWDRWPIGVLLGAGLGLLLCWEPLGWTYGWQLAACALLLAGRAAQPHIALPAPWAMAILAGLVAVIPAPFLWRNQAESLFCVGTAVMAAVMTPAFDRVVGIIWHKEQGMTWDDRICCLLALMALAMGGRAFAWGNLDLGGALGAMFIVGIAWASGAADAMVCGMAIGLALALAGSSPFMMISLPMCGMIAALMQRTRRPWAALCCVLGNALVTLCINGSNEVVLSLPNLLLGLTPFLFIPEPFWLWLRELLSEPRAPLSTTGSVAIQWLQTSANALEAMAKALPQPEAEPEGGIELLAVQLCEGCVRQKECWDEKYGDTFALMDDLLEAARHESLQPRELSHMARVRNCQRADVLPEVLFSVCRAEEREAHYHDRQLQASRLAKTQLHGQAELMHSICGVLTQSASASEGERLAVARALSQSEWRMATALTYRLDGLLHIILIPPEKAELGAAPVEALEQALQMPLHCAPLWEGLVSVSQAPAFQVELGVAMCPTQGQDKSGDNWTAETLPRGMQLLAVSDGMGNGEEAGLESSASLAMLKQGLEAGYARRELLSLINDLMRSCHGQERYATMDLCLIDLKTGEAMFDKLGACASFLIREGRCRRLLGGTLPLGILEDVSPRSFRMRLTGGDLLVMVTDGITDVFSDDRTLLKALSELPDEPQAFADGLLHTARQLSGGIARDDMTVLTARVKNVVFRP